MRFSLPKPIDPNDTSAAAKNFAVWPAELQALSSFTQKGSISNWDWYPEYLDGGFEGFKDIALGPDNVDNFHPSAALKGFATFKITGSSSPR